MLNALLFSIFPMTNSNSNTKKQLSFLPEGIKMVIIRIDYEIY